MNNVKRGEILFLYDCRETNPNGDPADENRPRMDDETGINIVTDVRLKRTIRDYILSAYKDQKGKYVFVKEERDKEGSLKTREERIKEILGDTKLKLDKAKKILEHCIDLRLFGATIAGKSEKKGENVFTWVGPVQFRFGHSLHRVEPKLICGTTVMPSGKGKEEKQKQGTFTECWVVPYSLICFYGVVNEHAAEETMLSNEDLEILREALWKGTKSINTRTKMGQMPRLLLHIEYNTADTIGDLDRLIKCHSKKEDSKIRSIEDFSIDVTMLLKRISQYKSKISCIHLAVDPDAKFVKDGKEIDLENELKQYCKVICCKF